MKRVGIPDFCLRECHPSLSSKVDSHSEKCVREAGLRSFPKQRLSDLISNLNVRGDIEGGSEFMIPTLPARGQPLNSINRRTA
ncbi:MAG TPA: hypothetical protein VLZ03_08815 [Thermodesulfobacteriota bacterium]|nr:hypothetical protein [Thermodesulfobacteriota bacterium]